MHNIMWSRILQHRQVSDIWSVLIDLGKTSYLLNTGTICAMYCPIRGQFVFA